MLFISSEFFFYSMLSHYIVIVLPLPKSILRMKLCPSHPSGHRPNVMQVIQYKDVISDS